MIPVNDRLTGGNGSMVLRLRRDARRHVGAPGGVTGVALAGVAIGVAAAGLAATGMAAWAQQAPADLAQPAEAPSVTIIGASPLLGSGVNRDTVPAETNVLKRDDLTRGGTTIADPARALNEQVGGASLASASGNPFQPTLFYHGFQASALQGTSQGLATYVNGVRFNQAFGDTVHFDLLPNQAIDEINLEGSNPVFGLNALGGALNVQLKNGFTYQGGEISFHGGSFGTYGADFQYGRQSGNTSVYVAGSGLHQGGWRDQQSSDLENFYGDIGWRGDKGELHFNVLLANSELNGPGTSPVELLAADRSALFTAPNRISDRFMQISLSGDLEISDTVSLQAVTYYNNFLQRVANGNAPKRYALHGWVGPAVQRVGSQHDDGWCGDSGFPGSGSAVLFAAGQPDDQHQWVWRFRSGDGYANRIRLRQSSGGRCQLRWRADRVHRINLDWRHHPGFPELYRPRHRSLTNPAPMRRSGWGSAMRIMACSWPTHSI